MKVLSYEEGYARFAELLDAVIEEGEEVVITRAGHGPAVLVAFDEYMALKETVYLMGDPANGLRIPASGEGAERG